MVDDIIVQNNKFIDLIFGPSNEYILKRLFTPNTECTHLTSRVVNVFLAIKGRL